MCLCCKHGIKLFQMLMSSKDVQQILSLVLTFGNYMNGGGWQVLFHSHSLGGSTYPARIWRPSQWLPRVVYVYYYCYFLLMSHIKHVYLSPLFGLVLRWFTRNRLFKQQINKFELESKLIHGISNWESNLISNWSSKMVSSRGFG